MKHRGTLALSIVLASCGGAQTPEDASQPPQAAATTSLSDSGAPPVEPSQEDPGLAMLDTGAPAQSSATPAPTEEDPTDTTTGSGAYGLGIEILPEPVLSLAQAKDYRLQLRIKNNTDAPVDAPWADTALLLNGRERHDWKKLTGSMPAKTIAPKETVEFIYQPSDKAVVKAGIYEFVLKVGAQRSAPAQLIVSGD